MCSMRVILINTRLLPIGIFLGADDITTQTDDLRFYAPQTMFDIAQFRACFTTECSEIITYDSQML